MYTRMLKLFASNESKPNQSTIDDEDYKNNYVESAKTLIANTQLVADQADEMNAGEAIYELLLTSYAIYQFYQQLKTPASRDMLKYLIRSTNSYLHNFPNLNTEPNIDTDNKFEYCHRLG